MDKFLDAAIEQARLGRDDGNGIPIGAVLVINGEIVARGYNRRVQDNNPILHAEMVCLANAGRLGHKDYANSTLYSTLSPCDMCSGAALLYKIPLIVAGEHTSFKGPEDYLESRGTRIEVVHSQECIDLLAQFKNKYPDVWKEDICES